MKNFLRNITISNRFLCVAAIFSIVTGKTQSDSRLDVGNESGNPRVLTPLETEFLRAYFKDAIDYDKIRIHRSASIDKVLNEMRSGGVTRDNNIFIKASPDNDVSAYIPLHEAAHVWQNQNCVQFKFIEGLKIFFKLDIMRMNELDLYRYDISQPKDLTAYGSEQQASIIADAFVEVAVGKTGPAADSARDKILANFKRDPSYAKNKCLPWK